MSLICGYKSVIGDYKRVGIDRSGYVPVNEMRNKELNLIYEAGKSLFRR